MDNSKALVPLQPKFTYAEAKDFAVVAAKSAMFLSLGVTEPNKALAIIMMGREMGLGLAASLRGIWIGDSGIPQLYTRVMASLIKQSGEYDYETLQWTDKIAEIQFSRNGKPLTPTSIYTEADARQAGLLDKKGNVWSKHRKNMLWSRALSNGFGIHCPHLSNGMPVYAVADEEAPPEARKYAQTADTPLPANDTADAEFEPAERPGGLQVSDSDYRRFLDLATQKGSSLESIRQHHKLDDLRLMTKEVYNSIMRVLETK